MMPSVPLGTSRPSPKTLDENLLDFALSQQANRCCHGPLGWTLSSLAGRGAVIWGLAMVGQADQPGQGGCSGSQRCLLAAFPEVAATTQYPFLSHTLLSGVGGKK